MVLEDLTAGYKQPSIMDIKIGFRTWHSSEDPASIEKARKRDEATAQGTTGFRICGLQAGTLTLPE